MVRATYLPAQLEPPPHARAPDRRRGRPGAVIIPPDDQPAAQPPREEEPRLDDRQERQALGAPDQLPAGPTPTYHTEVSQYILALMEAKKSSTLSLYSALPGKLPMWPMYQSM